VDVGLMPDTLTRVPSQLPDLRSVPLADMPGLDAVTLGEAVGRVIPDAEQAAPVTVAAFQSSIG
jgi:FXSXX-COOH protein